VLITTIVLDGCETWFLALTEKQRPSVFENRVLRGIFGPKRKEEKYRGIWIMGSFKI
jgi:hypothetical protein